MEKNSDEPRAYLVVDKTRVQAAREMGITVQKLAKLERTLMKQGKLYRSSDGKTVYMRHRDSELEAPVEQPKVPRGKPK